MNPNVVILKDAFEDQDFNKRLIIFKKEFLNIYRQMNVSHPCIYLKKIRKTITCKIMLWRQKHKKIKQKQRIIWKKKNKMWTKKEKK